MNDGVYALVVHDAGGGPALYAGGSFTTAGGTVASCVAKWDGHSWTPLDGGLDRAAVALAVHDDGGGMALYAGGGFYGTTGIGDSHLAKWGCDTTAPLITCPDRVVVPESFGGPPGAVATYAVTASDESGEEPVIACDPPSGSWFPRGTTIVACTATDGSGNISVREFQVIVQRKAQRLEVDAGELVQDL